MIPTLAIDPFDEAFLADPYAHHDALRDAGPVVWLEARHCYGIARHAEVQAVLKDHETFVSGRGVGLADFAKEEPWRPPSLLLETDPPVHDRTRGLMNKVATLASLRDARPAWLKTANRLADALVARRRFDAVTDLAETFPLSVFPDLIGLMDEGREHLLPYGMATFNAFGPRNALFAATNATAAPTIAWIAKACERPNLKPGGWGMATYDAADRGDCTEDEAARLVRSFLSAGLDTTVNGIGHLILAFATFPDQWAKLRTRPELAKRALDESLRWDSTAQTFFRTTSRDAEISGMTIPEGSKIVLFLGAANRDPRKWDQPERFNIERATSGHVGLGFGIHQCLGQMVARMESEVLLEALIPRIRAIRLTGAPVRRLNNTLHALASLPVEITPA
jgi:4-methoxybenzoate monooxygenase (O-demethylating)